MPHYPVLQPNGLMAVFSTIPDAFTHYDLSDEEAAAAVANWHTGNIAGYVADTRAGNLLPHQMDWTEALTWHLYRHDLDDDALAMIAITPPDQRQSVAYCVHMLADQAAEDTEPERAASITARADSIMQALGI